MYETWQDGYGTTVFVVHVPEDCEGSPCTIHHPSNHGMVGLRQRWNDVDKYMERICPHGVGHTDPDEIRKDDVVHGCDGCCALFLGDQETKPHLTGMLTRDRHGRFTGTHMHIGKS